MSLEWFDRVTGELQDHLESICEKYDQTGHMTIDRSAKHPRIEFFVETVGDEREYFCSLFFDPHNEEFYIETFDVDLEQPARTILGDIDDIVDAVHENFHEFLNEDDTEVYYVDEENEDDGEVIGLDNEEEYYVGALVDDDEEYYHDEVMDDDGGLLTEIDVEWETPEVTAFQKDDEVEVTYQFGVVSDTGDGVLRRVNRIWTEEDELVKDESNFIFTKEEAGTIIAMIASHMDSLTGYEDMDY